MVLRVQCAASNANRSAASPERKYNMPIKYTFGGLGHLAECLCGCSEFVRAENVKPEHMVVYECANCHEWFTANVPPNTACTRQVESSASQSDSIPEDLPAPEVLSQPATCG